MSEPFRYRYIAAAWGLSVDLTATSRRTEPAAGHQAVRVSQSIFLEILDSRSTEEDREQLARGLAYAAPKIEEAAGHQPLTVTVERLDYPLTDYQPEAAAVAIVQWSASEFGFDPLPLTVEFSKAAGKYVIELGPTP